MALLSGGRQQAALIFNDLPLGKNVTFVCVEKVDKTWVGSPFLPK